MIKLRTMAGAILTNGNDLLLMKRSSEKEFYPGVWGTIGGHVEPPEMNDPEEACLREIFEETGFSANDLSGLALRYIVLRRSGDQIRLCHVFIAETLRRDFTDCDEGELHWVRREEALEKPMSAFTHLVMARYLDRGVEPDVLVGSLVSENRNPRMEWSRLTGWEGL